MSHPSEYGLVDVGAARPIPPQWVVHEVLPEGLSFIGGPPKLSQKSLLTYHLAGLVAGLPTHLHPPFMCKARKGRALFLTAEADAGTIHDIVKTGLGVEIPPDGSWYAAEDPLDWRLDHEGGLAKLLALLDHWKPILTVLDPLRRFHNAEEKDSSAMQAILQPIRKWAIENHSAFLVVHHTRKLAEGKTVYDPLDMRGSGDLFALADGVLMVTPQKDGWKRLEGTFKRGKEWVRTLKYGCYGEVAAEWMSELDNEVLRLLKAGSPSVEATARQLGVANEAVSEACAKLGRNGLIERTGNGPWRAKR